MRNEKNSEAEFLIQEGIEGIEPVVVIRVLGGINAMFE